MRTRSSVIRASAGAVAFMACLAHVVESRQAPAGRLRAGAAKAEITPKQSDLTIATDSIRDPLRIWAGQQTFACPGRIRDDADNPARENVFPGHKDGPDVNLKVGVLRIGDVHFVSVNAEVYSQIGMRVKAEAPAAKTMIVTLANGSANSGYIYSDEAYSHLTFQVIGSRLKPGCAEEKIVAAALDLMHRSGR